MLRISSCPIARSCRAVDSTLGAQVHTAVEKGAEPHMARELQQKIRDGRCDEKGLPHSLHDCLSAFRERRPLGVMMVTDCRTVREHVMEMREREHPKSMAFGKGLEERAKQP